MNVLLLLMSMVIKLIRKCERIGENSCVREVKVFANVASIFKLT